jgi:anti-sigma factor RsiW
MSLKHRHASTLAQVLLLTKPEELTCDQWLEEVPEYVELHATGQEIPKRFSLLEHHLAICPECAEELKAMVTAVMALDDSVR